MYANLATYSYFTNSAILGVGIEQLSFTAPSFGEPGVILRNGMIYNQADLYKVTLDPGVRPTPGSVNSGRDRGGPEEGADRAGSRDFRGGRDGELRQVAENLHQ